MPRLLEISKTGHLAYLLSAAIGAYNRRTDAIIRSNEINEEVRKQTARIKESREQLQREVQESTEEK